MIEVKDYTGLKPAGVVEEMFSFAADVVGLDGVKVVVAINKPLLTRLSRGDIEYTGLLFNTGMAHSYVLYVADVSEGEMRTIIAHETAHLAQQERGDLVVDTRSYECTWKGVRYGNSFPYMDRPWEKEAFKVQSNILKQYKKSKKRK